MADNKQHVETKRTEGKPTVENDAGMLMNPVDDPRDHKGSGNVIPATDDHAQIRQDNLVNPDGTTFDGPRTQEDADKAEADVRQAERARQDKLRGDR